MTNQNSKAPRAKVAPVQVGTYTIQGLMDHEGRFFVAVPQIADVFQVSRNTAARDLNRLMGDGFKTSIHKLSTEFNRRPINAVALDDFGGVIRKFAYAGDPKAQAMVDALSQATLHQVFCDAFGIEFSRQDRQAFLVERMNAKVIRNELEDAVCKWLARHPEVVGGSRDFLYINATQRMYMGLWGKCRKSVAADHGLTTGDDLRSHLSLDQLLTIQTVERLAARMINVADMNPKDAVDEAINRSMTTLCFAD